MFVLYPCISYFSVAVLKVQGQVNLEKEESVWAYSSEREEFIREGKNDSQQQT